MIRNTGINKILWVSTATLALIAALVGVFDSGVYNKLVSPDLMPGIFGQDLMTILASVVILTLTVSIKKKSAKKQIILLGLLGYLFYAYGIYVIERAYNLLYYVYMAIFALSFWSMIYGAANIYPEVRLKAKIHGLMRYISAGFSLLVALIFDVLWIIQLLPLVQTGEKIESLYSVYILDLCFIMPAFVILGIMTIRKNGLGLLLIPAMFVLGFTLIFSLALSELVKPLFGLSITAGGLIPSLVLSIVFLVLAGLHLQRLQVD